MQEVRKLENAAPAGAPGAVYRRASDPALRRAAEVVRKSFVQIAERRNVADGDVIRAMAEALAAVESALPPDPGAEELQQ